MYEPCRDVSNGAPTARRARTFLPRSRKAVNAGRLQDARHAPHALPAPFERPTRQVLPVPERSAHRPRLRRITLAALCACAALTTACSRTTERELLAVSCGSGTLALELRVVTHAPAPSDVRFSFVLREGSRRRVVDVVKPAAATWTRIRPEERSATLREGPDAWPLFVNPTDFMPPDFERIRDCLKPTAAAFDSAAAQSRIGVSASYGTDMKLSSIRYVNYPSLARRYSGSKKGVTVQLYPDGTVWLLHPGGGMVLGGVVDGGPRMVLCWGPGGQTAEGIVDPAAYAMASVDPNGRRMVDEFTVERVDPTRCAELIKKEHAARAQR